MNTWRIILWAAIVFAALWFLWTVRLVVLPFALGYVVAVLLDPPVRRLRIRGVSRPIAVLSISLLFFLVTGGGIVAVAPSAGNQIRELRSSIDGLTAWVASENERDNVFLNWNPVVRAEPPGGFGWIDSWLTEARPLLSRFRLPSTRQAINEQYIEPHRNDIAKVIQDFFNGFLSALGMAASMLLLLSFVPLFAVLFLLDMDKIRLRIASWIPPTIRANTVGIVRDVGEVFTKYLRGVTIMISIYTVLMGLLLGALQTPYFLLLALLCGALYLIEVIGGWISTIAVFLVVGLSGQTHLWGIHFVNSWVYGLVVIAVFSIVNTAFDVLVKPRILGKAVGLHPLVSMFVTFAGGSLFGIVGMVIAYPIAGAIKTVLERLIRLTTNPTPETVRLPALPLRHRNAADG